MPFRCKALLHVRTYPPNPPNPCGYLSLAVADARRKKGVVHPVARFVHEVLPPLSPGIIYSIGREPGGIREEFRTNVHRCVTRFEKGAKEIFVATTTRERRAESAILSFRHYSSFHLCFYLERNDRRRPQSRRDYPLNLSILLSGGKETNQDFLSSCERRGNSPALNPPVQPQGNVVFGRIRLTSRGA